MKWIWISFALSAVFLVVTNKGSIRSLLIGVGFMLLFLSAIYFTLRSQLNKKRTQILVSASEISCEAFGGKVKKFEWIQVSSASIEMVGSAPVLQLKLNANSGARDKKSFINGLNPSKPSFTLAPYSPEDQEKILDVIHSRLISPSSRMHSESSVNLLRLEREFQEKLKAMAPRTWVTYGLVALNVAIWGSMVAMGADLLKPSSELLFQWGGNTAFAVQHGQWWRLLSATLLHAGFVHLVMNMFGLVVVGVTLERLFGHKLFLLIYLASGFAGSALSLHFSAQKAVSVGASGAIFGIAGALLVAVFKHRKTLPQVFSKQMLSGMGFFVIYSLIQGFGKAGTDNAAHIGGLLAGCLTATILSTRLVIVSSPGRRTWQAPAALAVAAALILGLSLTAKHSEFDVQRAINGSASFAAAMESLGVTEAALLKEQGDIKAGKLTEREADNRSRAVHAPAYEKITAQLSSAWFLPGDSKNELLKEIRYAVALMTEALAMESVFPEGTTKAEPADPVRHTFLNNELVKVNARLHVLSQKLAAQTNDAKKQ